MLLHYLPWPWIVMLTEDYLFNYVHKDKDVQTSRTIISWGNKTFLKMCFKRDPFFQSFLFSCFSKKAICFHLKIQVYFGWSFFLPFWVCGRIVWRPLAWPWVELQRLLFSLALSSPSSVKDQFAISTGLSRVKSHQVEEIFLDRPSRFHFVFC